MKHKEIERKTYEVEEAGRLLGLGKNSAYRAIHNKQIPSIRIGGRILVPKAAIDRLLQSAEGE